MGRKNTIAFAVIALASLAWPAAAQLQTWHGLYQSENQIFLTTMVGEQPALGHTTRIPVMLVPLTLKFTLGGFTLDPNKRQKDAPLSAVDAVLQSPIFQPAAFPNHPETHSVPTQYLDAYQRSNFFNVLTGGTGTNAGKSDFHVLLENPVIIPRTLNVPLLSGFAEQTANGPRGFVDWVLLNDQLDSLLAFSPSNFVTVFLMDRVTIINFNNKAGHTAGGYHNHRNGTTYIFTSFNSQGNDVVPTGHEFAEWLVNPLGMSQAPGHVLPSGECSHGMEVGDPLHGHFFTVNLNGHSFTLEDLAFEAWFARGTPSNAINGWVTFQGLDLPNTPCQ